MSTLIGMMGESQTLVVSVATVYKARLDGFYTDVTVRGPEGELVLTFFHELCEPGRIECVGCPRPGGRRPRGVYAQAAAGALRSAIAEGTIFEEALGPDLEYARYRLACHRAGRVLSPDAVREAL